MTLAQHKILLAQKILNTEDKKLIKAIDKIFDQSEDEFDIAEADRREINRRLADIESGKTKLYTMSEVKKIVRKNFKRTRQ
jgi:putative addiction module component (TIGR02574 family)